jgi:hypothetical protein
MEIASRVDCFPPKLSRYLGLDHEITCLFSDCFYHPFGDTILVLGVWQRLFEAITLILQASSKKVVIVFSSYIVVPELSYLVAKSLRPCIECLERCCASFRLFIG